MAVLSPGIIGYLDILFWAYVERLVRLCLTNKTIYPYDLEFFPEEGGDFGDLFSRGLPTAKRVGALGSYGSPFLADLGNGFPGFLIGGTSDGQ